MSTTQEITPEPLTELAQLRREAEQYMVQVLGLAPRLLPSALEQGPHPLWHMAVQMRRTVVRRARLVHRLHVAAVNLQQQIAVLATATAVGQAPVTRTQLNPLDLEAVTALPAQISELDAQLTEWSAALTAVTTHAGDITTL